MMEVLGKGSVTILDPAKLQTDAYEVKRHKPIMVSGVILHSLPSGYRFDLRKRRLRAPLRPVSATDRELARIASASNVTARLIRRIAAEGADDTAPERARRRRALSARHRGRRGQRMSTARAKRPLASSRRRRWSAPRPAARSSSLAGELKIIETRVFRGPNYWSYEPAIKLVVDLGVLEQFPTNTIPGFVDGAARDAARESAATPAARAVPAASRSA